MALIFCGAASSSALISAAALTAGGESALVFAGSVIGAVIGLTMMAVTRGRSGGRIPFGPYLALGALLWVAAGPELLHLYGAWVRGEAGFFLSPARLPM